MKSCLSSFALIIVGLFLASCASTPTDCSAEKVKAQGSNWALQGRKMDDFDYKCGGDLRPIFEAGYEDGKRKFCGVSTAEIRGYSDGQTGRDASAGEADYPICDNRAELVAAYKKSHQKGLDVFCSTKRMTDLANDIGEKGQPFDFSTATYGACGAERLPGMQAAYEQGYKTGLTRFCSSNRIENDAFKDGSEGNPKADVPTKYRFCSEERKAEIQATYDKGYAKGLASFCSPAGVKKVAARQAQEGDSPDFPARLAICLDSNPQVKTDYPVAFRKERSAYVENRCTAQEGILIGRKDAEAGNQKRSEMPVFCSAEFFSAYQEGYLQGWKETKDKICDVSRAYNKGIDDARKRKDMAYSMPSQCPPEYLATLTAKYRNGYMYAKNQGKAASNIDQEEVKSIAPENYSPSKAREACKKAGHPDCDGVTSIACIEKGHPVARCRIKSDYIVAVDACFRKGFSPQQCQNVKDMECIEAGKNPFLCGNVPTADSGT